MLSYNIYNFVEVNVLNKDLATVNGYAVLEVVSGSMEPEIYIGDIVVIDTKVKEYKIGDIVTFYDTEGSFVTHRIISIEGDQMVTRGDNNNVDDNPTNTSEIVGKYKFKISKGGKILAAFKSPFTMIMILIIGIMVCVFISTDKNGNPVLDEEEKEYLEFQKYLDQKQEYEKIQIGRAHV